MTFLTRWINITKMVKSLDDENSRHLMKFSCSKNINSLRRL